MSLEASPKYIRRSRTESLERPWRYVYRVASKHLLASFAVGDRVRADLGGSQGMAEVLEAKGSMLRVRNGGGRELALSQTQLQDAVCRTLRVELRAAHDRLRAVVVAAGEFGSPAQQARARARFEPIAAAMARAQATETAAERALRCKDTSRLVNYLARRLARHDGIDSLAHDECDYQSDLEWTAELARRKGAESHGLYGDEAETYAQRAVRNRAATYRRNQARRSQVRHLELGERSTSGAWALVTPAQSPDDRILLEQLSDQFPGFTERATAGWLQEETTGRRRQGMTSGARRRLCYDRRFLGLSIQGQGLHG